MGKNSLVQSTTKGKKSTAKKKAAKKTAAKAKAAPKAKAALKAKAAAKAAPVSKKKTVSVKDLLMKKFPAWKPEKLYTVRPEKADLKDVAAPPFFSGPETEQKRIKELLLKKFDLAEIKAAAEKAAAEKAAAEKAAAEKAAAEKAAAEKAAAEKAAAEKAAAEKAAAEKAAAEKAAAEKAAAEKAAAEKAAAEKAAAEKAAAEKAAAEKAAAEPEVMVSYEPPDTKDTLPPDPMDKAIKYMVAVVAILIALVVGSSMINQGKYYIHSTDGALEIFQGRFAPMGEKLLISLPGVQPPAKTKDVYSKTDVFPLIFNFYVDKADNLLKVPGLPDFQGIKTYINKAMPYALTPDSKDIVYSRLNNIDMIILLYKADVAASKATLADLKEAKAFLAEASRLDIDNMQLNLIHQKMDAVDKKVASLKARKKGAASPALVPPTETQSPASALPAGKKSPAPVPHGETKTPAPATHGNPHGE